MPATSAGMTTMKVHAPPRHARPHGAARAAHRHRTALGRPLSAVAAGDRPRARGAAGRGPAHDLGLSGRLRGRPDRLRAARRPSRPQAGDARLPFDLLHRHPGMRRGAVDRGADRRALRAGLRGVRAYLAIVAAGYAGLFAFISGSPFVLQIVHGLTPFGFGLSFAAASVGYVIGTSLAARLVIRLGLDRTIGWGALAMAFGGLAMVPATALMPEAVAGIVAPMMVYLFGMGLAMPQALAGALQPFPHPARAAP